jgi:hypothetical protein
MASQTFIIMPLPLPLATNNVTAIAIALASKVTITAAASNVTSAFVVATAATTAAIILNVVALTATIAIPIGLASAGVTDIALNAVVVNAAAFPCSVAPHDGSLPGLAGGTQPLNLKFPPTGGPPN